MVFRDMEVGGVDVEVGVQVAGPLESTAYVVTSEPPSGTVVVAVDRGPYADLGTTDAIHRWCATQGLTLAGPRWGIYGDWSEGESALETEIAYRLR